MKNILDLISDLGNKEARITKQVFISPVFTNRLVATRVDGLRYTFLLPKTPPGWYRIRPVNKKEARIDGPAELHEIEDYLKHLGRIRIVIALKKNQTYQGIPEKSNRYGFNQADVLPVFLCDDTVNEFDQIIARYDGINLWFERIDQMNDPAKADYLRSCVEKFTEPEQIRFKGLTLEEKQAYAVRTILDRKLVEDRKTALLKRDIQFAGGYFIRFEERKDHYTVTYNVDGQQYTSRVTKDPKRTVLSAGLCLSGTDSSFDLKSLVTVIREAQRKHLVHIM
jgi:hypothetical protein